MLCIEIKEKILKLLKKYPNGLPIGEISKRLGIHRNTVSKYVFALKEAGLLECKKIGPFKVFFLRENDKKIKSTFLLLSLSLFLFIPLTFALPLQWHPAEEVILNETAGINLTHWAYPQDFSYIYGARIYPGTVGTLQIADSAITTSKIADHAVTGIKLSYPLVLEGSIDANTHNLYNLKWLNTTYLNVSAIAYLEKLGIGTFSPAYKLEVVGSARITNDLHVGGTVYGNLEGSLTPTGNLNMKGYDIYNATNINASAFWQGGKRVIDTIIPGTGLTGGGSGPAPTLSVVFGSTAGTVAEGNKQITLTAGNGLTGGGSVLVGAGGTLTLNVGQGTGIVVGPDEISLNLTYLSENYIDEGQVAGGDLTGTYPNPQVAKIRGYPVSTTAPSAGEALVWDGSQYLPTGIVTDSDLSLDANDRIYQINVAGTTHELRASDVVCTDCVTLGSETTGNYVATLTAGTGIVVTNGVGEGVDSTISIDTSIVPRKNVDESITGNWVFEKDVTIMKNLRVAGNITYVNSQTLNVNGSLIPPLDNWFDLGNSTRRWRNAYFAGTVYADTFEGHISANNVEDIWVNESGDTMTGNLQFDIVQSGNSVGIRWYGLSDEYKIYVRETAGSEDTDLVIEYRDNANNDNVVFLANPCCGYYPKEVLTLRYSDIITNATLRPLLNNVNSLGTSSYQWANIHGVNIYQNGNKVLDTATTFADSASSDIDVSGTYNSLNLQIKTGAVGSVEIADDTKFVSVQNSAGTEQFAVTDGSNSLQFAAGGGASLAFDATNHRITYSHADTSSQGSVDNSGGTVIQDVTLDTYGHVTGLTSVNLDNRYVQGAGSGSANYLAKWSSTNTLTTSQIYDDGTNVGIGTTSPNYKLDVAGDIRATGNVYVPSYGVVIGSTSRRTSGAGIELYGGTSSMILSVQDGNGRIQMKWNAQRGTSETFLVGGENAGMWEFDPCSPGTDLFKVRYASGSGKNAGDPITWTDILKVGTSTFNYYNKLVVDSSGNVGIGTTNPTAKLTLQGTVSSQSGPHIEAYTSADTSNPIFQILNWNPFIPAYFL